MLIRLKVYQISTPNTRIVSPNFSPFCRRFLQNTACGETGKGLHLF
ncbi:hypothetical protein BACCAP_00736 [Pseudoflavonifractor capillosus ATCC 29799]|uniref:Uncharacterized protein n=1 Tax=Pseudoflavonifractor capillosus ATCC 29799 TaxID=411467 RepID=A6NRA7_9FIRM|nr:hypothetical protein BACCAP_00736 [Pseudoflavonifractor capillosus ATCC 29799]